MNKNLDNPKDGALNPLPVKGIVTGNSDAVAASAGKPATSESKKSPSDFILPKWIGTDPAVLAGQQHDLLALMQRVGWFVYIMPVTATNGRTALRITISPPIEHSIGVTGTLNDQAITMDEKPVTE